MQGARPKKDTRTRIHIPHTYFQEAEAKRGGTEWVKKGVEKEKEPHETKRARFHRSDAQSAATDLPAVCVWLASTAVATERSK